LNIVNKRESSEATE